MDEQEVMDRMVEEWNEARDLMEDGADPREILGLLVHVLVELQSECNQ